MIGLVLFKGAVAWLTNSLSLLAQATDSLLDLLSGFITFIALRAADTVIHAEPCNDQCTECSVICEDRRL